MEGLRVEDRAALTLRTVVKAALAEKVKLKVPGLLAPKLIYFNQISSTFCEKAIQCSGSTHTRLNLLEFNCSIDH